MRLFVVVRVRTVGTIRGENFFSLGERGDVCGKNFSCVKISIDNMVEYTYNNMV